MELKNRMIYHCAAELFTAYRLNPGIKDSKLRIALTNLNQLVITFLSLTNVSKNKINV
jgi:hypothetical protein